MGDHPAKRSGEATRQIIRRSQQSAGGLPDQYLHPNPQPMTAGSASPGPNDVETMPVVAELDSLVFANGQQLDIPHGSVTLIVGPNNAGKSVLLTEIAQLSTWSPINGPPPPMLTLASVSVTKEGSIDSYVNWLLQNGVRRRRMQNDPSGQYVYFAANAQLNGNELTGSWSQPGSFGQGGQFVLVHQTTDSRLQLAAGTQIHNIETEAPRHPLQRLWQDSKIEHDFNVLLRRAFGFEISINRYAQSIDLKVGRPTLPDTTPPPSEELLQQYAALPSIMTQGDGVRSFVGLMLQTLVPRYRVTLVDEPEAFLHPPQARLLAQYMTEFSPPGSQLVLATHSQEVLQGVLDARGSRPVQIIRLTRRPNEGAVARVLDPTFVRSLSSDSYLQNSNVLNGLFHDCVVIGEADADCQYYRLAMQWLYRNHRLPDTLFTQVSGKSRVASVAEKLRQLGVPCACVVDFDVLNEKTTLQKIVQAFGGDWTAMESDYEILRASVDAPTGPTVGVVQTAVTKAVAGLGSAVRLDETRIKRISEALRNQSGWGALKRAGMGGVAQGPPQESAARLMATLATSGIFVVPVGELERWHPGIAGKSNDWLAAVLEADLLRQAHAQRDSFIQLLSDFLAQRTGRELSELEPLDQITNLLEGDAPRG